MISKVWAVDGSASYHCCFEKSVLIFDVAVPEELVSDEEKRKVGYKIAFETLDMDPAELSAVVYCLRSIHDK
jgi:hypothetical protein